MTAAGGEHVIKWVNFNMQQGDVGSMRMCVLLDRSNIMALVSGGLRPKYAPNTLMLWDDAEKRCVAECAVPGGHILNVFMNNSRLVLIQPRRVNIFSLQPLKFLRAEETGVNMLGVGALGGELNAACLAVPYFKQGTVQLIAVESVTSAKSLAPAVIEAHRGDIAVLSVNAHGTLLATGSAKGTVIRIFDTRHKLQLNELRRGTDPSTLHSVVFSPCSTYVAVSSDKGTVHVFHSRPGPEVAHRRNFFDNTSRSLAQFTIPEDTHGRLAFVMEDSENDKKSDRASPSATCYNSVIAICDDGSFHKFAFNTDGHSERRSFDYLTQLGSEQDFWSSPV